VNPDIKFTNYLTDWRM